MPDRGDIQVKVLDVRTALDELERAALLTVEERDALVEMVAARDITIGELRQQLADCQDTQPPPPPDPLPSGTLVKRDDITSSNVIPFWGQHSREGRTAGSTGTGTIELRNDGPLLDGGVRANCRRIHLPAGERRNEVGQVNEDTGIAYDVEKKYRTDQWYRLPDLTLADRFNVMQMKHSGDTDGDMHGGFGGEPVTSAPPLSLKRFARNELELIERSGDYNGKQIWHRVFEPMRWWQIFYVIHYSFEGSIELFWRYEGEEPESVFKWDGPTIKANKPDGNPMYSTYRVGLYGDPIGVPTFADIAPSAVYLL